MQLVIVSWTIDSAVERYTATLLDDVRRFVRRGVKVRFLGEGDVVSVGERTGAELAAGFS